MRRRLGEGTRINPLTAALIFVSITPPSAEVYSFAETIASSFSGSSWAHLIVKNFARSDLNHLMLITHLRFRLRNFTFPRHEQRTPGETSGRHSS